ncbi:hypothetical protein AGMMS49592_6230 [Endomicrobiia bacterium]|nr:hypothetical protein AGMMS49592_6230 [Endomicrobiia bacterium]
MKKVSLGDWFWTQSKFHKLQFGTAFDNQKLKKLSCVCPENNRL